MGYDEPETLQSQYPSICLAIADAEHLETYGRALAITRQILIYDDLDAFTRIPAMYGTTIATCESDMVWGIVTIYAAMAGGVALFHATH